jgi:hypothetical protein
MHQRAVPEAGRPHFERFRIWMEGRGRVDDHPSALDGL